LGRCHRLDWRSPLAGQGLDIGAGSVRGGAPLDGLGVPLDLVYFEILSHAAAERT